MEDGGEMEVLAHASSEPKDGPGTANQDRMNQMAKGKSNGVATAPS